jgi:hypothetical protein
MWGTMIPLNLTVFRAAYTAWYICAVCGFVETWVERPEDLVRVREKLGSR